MLNHDQMNDALTQLRLHCDAKMQSYEMISVRQSLYDLGYANDVDQILQAIYVHGFTYCMDHRFKCHTGIPGDTATGYPSQDVCFWGPDQLKSRLPTSFWILDK